MVDEAEQHPERGVSRRTLIKGGMAVGAAVWTAPVIDSIVTSAAAASKAPGSACPAHKCDGTASPTCGNSGAGGVCMCAPTVEQSDACVTALALGPLNCTSSGACGPGFHCIQLDPTTCFGFTSACAADCAA